MSLLFFVFWVSDRHCFSVSPKFTQYLLSSHCNVYTECPFPVERKPAVCLIPRFSDGVLRIVRSMFALITSYLFFIDLTTEESFLYGNLDCIREGIASFVFSPFIYVINLFSY